MEIKEFVSKVLRDLVEAVEEVRAASVREMKLTSNSGSRTVEFDMAVSVESATDVSGKAGIKVLEFIQAGGDVSETQKNSTVSRVKFGVDIESLTKDEEARLRAKIEANDRKLPTHYY